ncbi:MAG: hypothetical protein CMK42_05565 [Porticoccaceae bacterium]|nr:hypothetical protein [Porticoccaceae bacterium]
MEYVADNLTNLLQNNGTTRSRILDTDYALATTELALNQIIQQVVTSEFTEANQHG